MARARPSSLPDPLDRPVGAAPALQISCAQIRHLARFDAVGHGAVPTVLLPGEAGAGKGLVARVIHDSGPRAQGSFIEVNCAAIPDTLLEVELFGVEAGAFTDAKRAKPSLCEAASGGTLFLEALAGLWMIHEARGEFPQAWELSEQLLMRPLGSDWAHTRRTREEKMRWKVSKGDRLVFTHTKQGDQ
jgi:sigma54-dependent transcription regulator